MLHLFISSNRTLVVGGAVTTAVGTKMVQKQRSRNSHRVFDRHWAEHSQRHPFYAFAATLSLYESLYIYIYILNGLHISNKLVYLTLRG